MMNFSVIKSKFKVVLVLSLVGWVLSAYTLVHRQGILVRGLQEASSCNLGDRFNCDAVALSSYSSLLGIPVSSWGLAFYSILFVLALWGFFKAIDGVETEAKNYAHWVFAASVLSLLPTIALASTSLFVIRSICIFCLGIYVVNLGLAFSGWMLRSALKSPFSLKPLPGSLLGFFGGLCLLQLFSHKIVESSLTTGPSIDSDMINAYVSSHQRLEPKTIKTAGFPSWGLETAPVTIVEFSDFQCPYCKQAAATLPAFASAYGDKVRIVFRNYPLNSSCNAGPGVPSNMHPQSCLAAKAGHCVFKNQGNAAFFAYADEVFSNQEKISEGIILTAAARHSKMDPLKVKACTEDPATHQAILDDASEGSALDIQGTPAIYINGRFVEAGANAKVLKPLLDSYFTK